MCYAKPGPRCASHLTTDIKKLETEIKELEKDSSDVSKFKIVQKRSRLDTYRFAYDGTQKGQIQLQAALDSMDNDDPDYKDIKKYKDNARKEYDQKIRNFKEVERIKEERNAQKNDLLARKAKLEAELAALDTPIDVDVPDTDTPDADSAFTTGRVKAEAGARKAAADKRAARSGATTAAAYSGKGVSGYSGKGGGYAARTPVADPIAMARGPRRSSTTSYAYGGKGFGGK